MISAVSFGDTTQASTFAERIKQPQTYTVKQEEPSAAASIRGRNKKQSAGKKFFKLLAFAAAVAGALALAAKSGKFQVPEGATGTMDKLKGFIDKAGNKVIETAKKIMPAAKEAAAETADKAVDAMA